MRLRIVAGEFGGRRIEAPPGAATRPTREAVREAWFAALGDRVAGVPVLDLFAGSGALGLEALSRGAAAVDFVESSRSAFGALERNIAALDVADRVTLYREDAFNFLRRRSEAAVPYGIALADPPYASDAAARLIELNRSTRFADLLCVEGGTRLVPGDLPGLIWQRRYGDTVLVFVTPNPGGTTSDH